MLLHELSTEVLTCIAGHLETKQLIHFSLACHKFLLIAHSESLWREKLYNDFGISYKLPDEEWKALYEKKCDDPTNNRLCPHIGHVSPHILKPYAFMYQQVLNWLPKNLNCTICSVNCARTGLCLYVWKGNTRNRKYSK
jgi:hypothetical protein